MSGSYELTLTEHDADGKEVRHASVTITDCPLGRTLHKILRHPVTTQAYHLLWLSLMDQPKAKKKRGFARSKEIIAAYAEKHDAMLRDLANR